jgi:hypothetical protein
MKYLFFSIILLFSFTVFVPQTFALNLGGDILKNTAEKGGYDKNTDGTSLSQNIGLVVNIVLSIIGVLFTILTVYAGYTWMIARGEETKIDKAKKIITASIIGLIITLGAYSITNFIIPRVLDQTLSLSIYKLFV